MQNHPTADATKITNNTKKNDIHCKSCKRCFGYSQNGLLYIRPASVDVVLNDGITTSVKCRRCSMYSDLRKEKELINEVNEKLTAKEITKNYK